MNAYTQRTMTCAVAAVFGMVATAPVAFAANEEDDLLSRTFVDHRATVEYKLQPDGLGWYDINNPANICTVIIRAFGQSYGTGIYYTDPPLRIAHNLDKAVEIPGAPPVPVPCPFPVPPGNYHKVVPPAWIQAGQGISQSALLCYKQDPFKECFATSWDWDLYACNWETKSFSASKKPEEAFPGLPAPLDFLNLPSGAIDCTPHHAHDASRAITLAGVSANSLFSDEFFEEPKVVQLAHPGQGTSYVVSCLEVTTFDPVIGFDTDTSHDWFLALDRADATTDWAPAILNHLANGAQGLYNLGGQNGCPFPDTTCRLEPEDKPAEGPDDVKKDKDSDCDGVADTFTNKP